MGNHSTRIERHNQGRFQQCIHGPFGKSSCLQYNTKKEIWVQEEKEEVCRN